MENMPPAPENARQQKKYLLTGSAVIIALALAVGVALRHEPAHPLTPPAESDAAVSSTATTAPERESTHYSGPAATRQEAIERAEKSVDRAKNRLDKLKQMTDGEWREKQDVMLARREERRKRREELRQEEDGDSKP